MPNSVTTDGEGGLMGCALSPTWNGTTDKDVFFMHTSNDGGATQNRIVKMTFNGTSLSSRTVILGGIRSQPLPQRRPDPVRPGRLPVRHHR